MIKIYKTFSRYFITNETKINTLGVPEDQDCNAITVNGMLLNLTALYLNGDYLKGVGCEV